MAGDLLVAAVTGYGTTYFEMTASPADWFAATGTWSIAAGNPQSAIYLKVATGSDTAPTFTATTTGTAGDSSLQVVLYDLSDDSGLTPVPYVFGNMSGTSGSGTVTASAVTPSAGCFAIAAEICSQGTTAATTTWTAPASPWTITGQNQTASAQSQMCAAYQANPTSGANVAATFTHGRTSTAQAATILLIAPPSAVPSAFTVGATQSGTGAFAGMGLDVYTMAGAAVNPVGATASKVATTPNASITPLGTGSRIFGAVENNTASASFTAETATPFALNQPDSANAVSYGSFATTAVTTAGTPVLCGATNAGITAGAFAAAEILAAPGRTLTELTASEPVTAVTAMGLSLQTMAFVPPPGTLLMALVAADGNTGAGLIVNMTVASIPALTWTEQVSFHTATNAYAGVWTAFVSQPPEHPVMIPQAVKRAALW